MLRTRDEAMALLEHYLADTPEQVGATWEGDVSEGEGSVGGSIVAVVCGPEYAAGRTRRKTVRWQLRNEPHAWPALTLSVVCEERYDGIDLAASFGPEPVAQAHLIHASLGRFVVERIAASLINAGASTAGSGFALNCARQWSEAGERARVTEATDEQTTLGDALTRGRRFCASDNAQGGEC